MDGRRLRADHGPHAHHPAHKKKRPGQQWPGRKPTQPVEWRCWPSGRPVRWWRQSCGRLFGCFSVGLQRLGQHARIGNWATGGMPGPCAIHDADPTHIGALVFACHSPFCCPLQCRAARYRRLPDLSMPLVDQLRLTPDKPGNPALFAVLRLRSKVCAEIHGRMIGGALNLCKRCACGSF
jgi:hypothetical protein